MVHPEKKVTVLYDFLEVKGGAEAVALNLIRSIRSARLVVGWINRTNHTELEADFLQKHRSLGRRVSVPVLRTIVCSLLFRYRTIDLSAVDVAIFSGNNSPFAILKSRAKTNIYYCHTPPRFCYDLRGYYMASLPPVLRPMLWLLIKWYQPKFEAALQKMDRIVCNSHNVRHRLNQYLNICAEVVYPPIELDKYSNISSDDIFERGYYLSTARLESYKRIERLVSAFIEMPDKRLIVTSGGSKLKELRSLAKGCKNIEFTDFVSDDCLRRLVSNCKATIYIPINEDFGMSPVESIAAGKPVIGCQEGGLLETVVHGETGWLLRPNPSVRDIVELISSIDSSITDITPPEEMALLYGSQRFVSQLLGSG